MSTRRQRRSPKWLKRQRQRAARKVSIAVDHAQGPSYAVMVEWVEVGGQRLTLSTTTVKSH